MKVNIGTKSPTKVKAITDTLKSYLLFKNAKILDIKVESEVSDQPLTLKETIQGAKNRAKNAFEFENCDFSFGIESGLMVAPEAKSGYFDVTVCAIFDGKQYHLGTASLFEYPKQVIDLVFNKKLEISDAFRKAGLTKDKKIGYTTGVIGFVTKGRVPIVDYYKQAITNALIHIENPHLY